MLRPAALFCLLGGASAHVSAWHKGMYCLDGNSATTDLNSYAIVLPLYQLPFSQWWMHAFDGCNKYPPAEGDYLEIPAGGSFQIEIASNRAKTTLAYGGRDVSDWPDGQTYPEDYNVPSCIVSPVLHTQNQTRAAGTAFAISYQSDINNVTPENLAVFSVRYNTPWKRVVWYDVPAAMPPCPAGGCICAWGWVPNGCGQPNIYQTPFKCRVTRSISNAPLAAPKPPVWCEGNPGACTKGAKQMIYWNQNEGNNIVVSGYDQAGDFKSPAYNSKLGFNDGAQNDIFSSSGSSSSSSSGSSDGSSSGSSSGSVPKSNTPGPSANAPTPSSNASNASSNTPDTADTTAPALVAEAASSTASTATSAASESALAADKNRAPSCSSSKRHRHANTSLVRKSSMHQSVVVHKRHNLRRGF